MGMEVSSNWGSVADRWAAIEIQAKFRTWMDSIGPPTQEMLRAKAPKGKVNGGRFASTIRYRPVFASRTKTLNFYSRLSYAPYIINDTAPHRIVPRHAKALMWPGAAHPVRYGSDGQLGVQHPGTKANTFAEELVPEIRALASAKWEEIVGQIIGEL